MALSTAATAWLLDPAIKKIFLDKDLTMLYLIPIAIISVGIGYYLQKIISEKIFFNIIYILLFVSGLKLIYDGIF